MQNAEICPGSIGHKACPDDLDDFMIQREGFLHALTRAPYDGLSREVNLLFVFEAERRGLLLEEKEAIRVVSSRRQLGRSMWSEAAQNLQLRHF